MAQTVKRLYTMRETRVRSLSREDPLEKEMEIHSSNMSVGPQRRLSTEKLMLLSCGVGEDSWESLGLQGDQTSQS